MCPVLKNIEVAYRVCAQATTIPVSAVQAEAVVQVVAQPALAATAPIPVEMAILASKDAIPRLPMKIAFMHASMFAITI